MRVMIACGIAALALLGSAPSADAQRWCGSLRCHCRVLQCSDVPKGMPSPGVEACIRMCVGEKKLTLR
jgi:hypothetical protein